MSCLHRNRVVVLRPSRLANQQLHQAVNRLRDLRLSRLVDLARSPLASPRHSQAIGLPASRLLLHRASQRHGPVHSQVRCRQVSRAPVLLHSHRRNRLASPVAHQVASLVEGLPLSLRVIQLHNLLVIRQHNQVLSQAANQVAVLVPNQVAARHVSLLLCRRDSQVVVQHPSLVFVQALVLVASQRVSPVDFLVRSHRRILLCSLQAAQVHNHRLVLPRSPPANQLRNPARNPLVCLPRSPLGFPQDNRAPAQVLNRVGSQLHNRA